MFTETSDTFGDVKMPLQERVVDKLADMLFASDMILDMLNDERSFKFAGHLTSGSSAVRRFDPPRLGKQLIVVAVASLSRQRPGE